LRGVLTLFVTSRPDFYTKIIPRIDAMADHELLKRKVAHY
jgi:hypothetical protein